MCRALSLKFMITFVSYVIDNKNDEHLVKFLFLRHPNRLQQIYCSFSLKFSILFSCPILFFGTSSICHQPTTLQPVYNIELMQSVNVQEWSLKKYSLKCRRRSWIYNINIQQKSKRERGLKKMGRLLCKQRSKIMALNGCVYSTFSL